MGEKSTRPDWQPTKHPGVRMRLDPIRKHGRKPDAYFSIYYTGPDGKRKQEGCGWASDGWSEQKAAEVLGQIKASIRRGEGHQSLREKRAAAQKKREDEARKNITFAAIAERYWHDAQGTKGPRSLASEKKHLERAVQAFGSKALKSVSPFDLERLKRRMSDNDMAPRTIAYGLAVVRQVFSYATKHELFEGTSPTAKVKMPTSDNRRLRFLTHAEAQSLLDALKSKNETDYRHALISLHAGLRFGEIAALTWADVDTERGSMTLRDTKSGKTRVAFMTGQMREAFVSMPRGLPSALVFTDSEGLRLSKASSLFRRVVDELGFNDGIADSRQKVVFHTLRHTFASWLVENGTDLYTVKELMGHADFKMVSRYAHLSPEHMRKAVKGLEASIKAKAEPSRKVLAFRGGE